MAIRQPIVVDLRSDVVAPPTEAMWEAMRRAPLGWAYVGEDPSVNQLEALAADLLGKEAALFVPSCSLANLLALLTLGERGTQAIVEATAHVVTSEEWGIVSVAALVPRLLAGNRGVLDPAEVTAAITSASFGRPPRTSVVCLENTHNNAGGRVLTADQTAAVAEVARRHGASVHLDGARLFNAAIALGVPARSLAATADTIAISLNKGLGAPDGALLVGTRGAIAAARWHAKRLGAGSLHKAGLMAAAGLVALTTMVDRLAEDHHRARRLAELLTTIPGLRVDPAAVETNVVPVQLVDPAGTTIASSERDPARFSQGLASPDDPAASAVWPALTAPELVRRLAEHGVLALARSDTLIRLITHRLIGDEEVERAAAVFRRILATSQQPSAEATLI
ncbi:MAG: aminotransferase class I/II-fold pyridoxal phosphate-dependent enzyme [Chloroflexi bacterium]|nr:aminotransferase class I/II-fold pyridoxal phosphate-dependent enzyme [Chloroflexota bacterium]